VFLISAKTLTTVLLEFAHAHIIFAPVSFISGSSDFAIFDQASNP